MQTALASPPGLRGYQPRWGAWVFYNQAHNSSWPGGQGTQIEEMGPYPDWFRQVGSSAVFRYGHVESTGAARRGRAGGGASICNLAVAEIQF